MKQKIKFIYIFIGFFTIISTSCKDDFLKENFGFSAVGESIIYISPAWEESDYQFQCAGLGNSKFTIETKPDWLQIKELTGNFENDIATIYCKANEDKDFSTYGIYIDQLVVKANEKKYAIPVYYVNEGEPKFKTNSTFNITYEGSFLIQNIGKGVLLWDIVSMPYWLKLTYIEKDPSVSSNICIMENQAINIHFGIFSVYELNGTVTDTIIFKTNDKNNSIFKVAVRNK
ncbi:MAG: hypothetical protein LBV69_00625 [Bacteroidales bacterium]|jgi:hypothetical protein|nr:hypothetical protein [Bacteroidales bacterium]